MLDRRRNHLWYRRLDDEIARLGGMFNAHLHLDRAGTLDEVYMEASGHRILENSHVSLHQKHSLINDLHAGKAYQGDDFDSRVNAFVSDMVAVGTRRADTLVDVTEDGVGLMALRRLEAIKAARAGEIDIRIGAYSPFGFVDAEPGRWDLMERGAEQADFLAALPEADDRDEYPTHIGFHEHCVRLIKLARQHGKMLHVHVDQRNEPAEAGTERLLDAIRETGGYPGDGTEPMIWAVHMISPSTYDDVRFQRLVDGLLAYNVGVITCPSAAIGMRMYRPLQTPTYNSIPRILELLAAGVQVRMGSDNIADICSPSTTADLVDEVFVLSAAIRFYEPRILAKLATGLPLDAEERAFIKDHLVKNEAAIHDFMNRRTKTPDRTPD